MKMLSAYERIQLLEQLKKTDWDLEKESLILMTRFAKLKFDGYLKAGFTEKQAIELVRF